MHVSRLRELGLCGAIAAAARRLSGRLRRIGERLRDRIDGVDTATWVEAGEIETDSVNKTRGIRYQPTDIGALREVMRALPLPRGARFVDIGAGKGRVLMLALEFDVACVVGVEYSEALCRIARRNLEIVQSRRPREAIVRIHACDAATYGFPDDENVIYLFNPFDAVVLEQMLAQLAASLQRTPRRLWLIYHFPRWHRTIDACGFLQARQVHRSAAGEFATYEHDPARDAPALVRGLS